MKKFIFCFVWIVAVTADSYDFGSCAALQDPVASHPRYGHDVKAGSLEVFEKDGEIVARPICDNEQGFILINDRFTEMRCSYNPYTGKWTWNHHHRDRRAPPLVRCAHVSPKPRVQRFRLGASFTGCSDPLSKEETLSAFEERLTSSLPCVLTDECTISDLSCEATESDTVLSVKITSMSTRKVMEQQLMLETAAEYLRSSPLHSLVTSQSGRSGRVKRFDPSGFDDATTEDVDTSGCGAGYITNADETCTQCTAGTYPDTAASPQVCASCAYDTYRSDLAANECTACGAGLGTLEEGSDAVADCIAICTVPTMKFVASTSPESRVADGGNVEMTCAEGYSYGNSGTRTVVCSSSTNNFPASCRKVTVSATQASVKAGDNGALSCVVEAHDVGTAIQWFKGEDVAALTSDGSAYTIATTLATAFEADGITKKSTSSLSILAFDSADVASYSCRIDYADPILDDNSPEQALAILDLTVTPSTAQIVSEAASLQLSCAMNLDSTYSTRTVTWKLNSGADITTGVTTSTSSSAYTSVLSLSSVAIADAGTYTCTATYALSDGSGPVVLTGTVDVTVRGFETHPTAMNVDIGSQIVISCVTVGDQQPSISWKKGETVVSGDVDTYDDGTKKTTSTLTIASATSDDSGDYKCTADFGGTTIESNVATVNVYDIGITVNPVDTAHLVGEDAVLSCMVKNPEGATPSLSWIKVGDTETVQDNANINFDNANPGKSTLTFTSATIEQAGVYKCQAVYVIGEQQITRTSTTANLFIRELSKELDEYTGVTALGGSQTFTCEYHGDNAVSGVAWTYNDGVLPTGYSITQQGSYSTSTSKWESVLTVNPIIKSSGGAVKCTFSFTGTGADISSTSNFRVRYVAPLTAEAVSSAAAYTVTCNYQGTDDPSVSWTVGGSVVSNSDEGITITEGSLASNDRSDKLTISGRTYSDASKAITCKYSFTNPTAELTANTVLKFRGLNAGLNAKYYSTGDAVTMECSLGVGSDGGVPSETAWFHNYADVSSIGLVTGASYDIVTDASVTNGLFKSTLTIKAAGITTANSGNYRCQFKISESEAYHSEGALVVRLVTISPSDANIYSYANAGLQLSCTLDASDSKSGITWTGPGGTIIDASKYSNDEGNANIHIVSLDGTAASGEYKCTFAFTEGSSTVPEGVFSNVNLNLLEMTSPAALYSTYGAGVSVTLTCQVTSPSQLTLTFHDGSTDLPATTTKYEGGKTIAEYTITVDAANKGGTFQCRKSATETSTTSTTLTVLSMATPPASPTRANDGVTVTISCVAQSHTDVTPPTFSWLKDGSAVTETPEADVVALDGSTVTSKLPIVVSSANDGSVYKCVATYTGLAAGTNLESSTTVTMNKIVPSSLVTVSTFVGEAATLSCVATAADGVDIKWRKKAAGWTAESPTYDALTGSQDAYDVGAGTRTSTLTYSSPVTSDSSDSVECYDSTVGITAVMALEVIGTTAVNQEVKSGQQAVISCQVDGLLSVLDSVAWKKSTGETISGAMADFEIADGAYTSATKSQTTTLTVKNGINTADTTYKCAVTRGAQTRETEVSLKVFTVTSTPKQVTTAVDQTLTCTIGELDASGTPVTVTWKDSSDATVSNSDTSNYVLVEGTVDGSGEQNAVLTIKTAKLASYSAQASFTYKCSVQYSGSPASTEKDVVANVLTFGVTAVGQEQLKDTEAKISCTVDGLTTALNGVKWTKSDNTQITSGIDGFVVVDGTLSGNSQTTILTVPAAMNIADATYNCLITSTEHGKLDESTSVSLNIFSLSELDVFYYSPPNVELTVEGRYEPEIAWSINGQSYSQSNNPNLTPTVKTAWDGSKKAFNLAFAMGAFPADMAPFTVSATISLGDASSATFPVGPFKVYKREFSQSLPVTVTLIDEDFPKEFDCAAQGESKDLFSLSWRIGSTTIDGDFTLASITDTSEASSATEKKSKLTIPANNPTFNDELKCVATWTGDDAKEVISMSDINAIGASMAAQTFSDGASGDGIMTCLVWGDAAPHSVSWQNPNEETISDVANEIVIASSTVGSVHTHTLTLVDMSFGDEGKYTCTVVIADGDTPRVLVTELSKLSASFVPSSPYFVHDNAVAFTCVYNGLEDPSQVEWFKGSTDDASTIITAGDKYGIELTEFNIASRSKSSVITFKNVAVTDSGDYTCKWHTTSFDPKSTMTVAIRSLTTPSAMTYSTDGSIKVTCNYEGTTSGTMEWFYKNQKLVDAEGDDITIDDGTLESNAQKYTLTIANVNPESNSGEYKCALSFSDGDKLEATTDVEVRKATAIDTAGTAESSIVVSDGTMSARCLFEGDKVPSSVTWSKGGSNIEFDSLKKIQNTNTKQLDNSIKFFSNITLKEFAFADQGSYTCTFVFADGNNVEASVNAISASITNDECVFVDYRTESSKALTCTYHGSDQVTGVSFTMPDNTAQTGQLGVYAAGGDADTAGTQTGTYTVTGITAASSGAYTCTFTLSDGSTVSAIQRLTARKAEVVSSTGNLSPNLIVRSSITLTCTVASGAKSIEWLKDSTVLTEGTDYEKIKVEATGSSDLVSKIEFDIASDSAGTYKCRGTQYDDFCATQRQFESEGVVLTIITATPLENPADATAYGGGSHTFTCRFPNPFVGQSYEIVWSFKGAGDSVAQPMIGNGDVYENGERIIDGTISKDHTTTSGEITTELAVANVDTNVAGEYICTVKWGTIFIKSNPATLTVRAISEPPMTTNVAKGGEAKFTCKTTGDAEGTITFHKAADDTPVGSVVATPVTVAGVVTTTGVLTIAAAADSDSFEYYCKATWSGTEVKSGNVYLAVIGITATTPTAWGVNSKSAQFECKSDAVLKKNAAGDALLDADGDDIRAAATITWEYYDTATTTWKATNEDNRFNIMSSLIGSDGIRVSPLSLRNLNSNEDGLKVRCNIAYVADADNRFFGATVTSTDMILKIAQISSVAASNIGPVTGETITLTCIAVGESAPTFMFTTGGKSSIDNTFFQEVEALAVSSDGTTHTAKYVTKAIAPNVLRNGEVITCEADYGISLGTSTKDLTVTTYYDCASVTVKSLNPDGNGATITPSDNGDGTLTQTITCPADTESARFVLMPTSNSAASITCSKSTGKYTPAFLARCKETRPFTSGYGKQLMGLSTFPIKPCSATDPTATGEWSPEKMKEKLNSMADTVCGFRHKVPCLKNGQCTLDTDKSGCSYDHENEQLIMEYYVNLNTPVWTFTEKDSLVKKEDGVIKFWECSESYTKRRRREAMENGLDFESFEVVEKRSANETFAGDSESDIQQSSHYVAATTVGVCAVVMVTALLTVLFVRLRRKQSQDIEAVELTNN